MSCGSVLQLSLWKFHNLLVGGFSFITAVYVQRVANGLCDMLRKIFQIPCHITQEKEEFTFL